MFDDQKETPVVITAIATPELDNQLPPDAPTSPRFVWWRDDPNVVSSSKYGAWAHDHDED